MLIYKYSSKNGYKQNFYKISSYNFMFIDVLMNNYNSYCSNKYLYGFLYQ